MIPYNSNFVANARLLRKNMTPEEKHLWYDFLKRLPMTVKRQHNLGNYIVDFYIAKTKTVIEIDGRQHEARKNHEADIFRDAELSKWGIGVLRYSNESIDKNFNTVCSEILKHLKLNFSDLKPIIRGDKENDNL